jgi:hypothetical protein
MPDGGTALMPYFGNKNLNNLTGKNFFKDISGVEKSSKFDTFMKIDADGLLVDRPCIAFMSLSMSYEIASPEDKQLVSCAGQIILSRGGNRVLLRTACNSHHHGKYGDSVGLDMVASVVRIFEKEDKILVPIVRWNQHNGELGISMEIIVYPYVKGE